MNFNESVMFTLFVIFIIGSLFNMPIMAIISAALLLTYIAVLVTTGEVELTFLNDILRHKHMVNKRNKNARHSN